jgi:hypothetical protein
MKRDMNLVREILMWVENQKHGYVNGNPNIEGYSEDEIGYHVYLMYQAGLVNAADTTSMGDKSPNALLLGLTWHGHQFVDAAKDETIWSKAKGTILKSSAGVAFDVLYGWLKAEARQRLGLP